MAHPDARLRRHARLFGIFAFFAAFLSLASVFTEVSSVAAPLWRGGALAHETWINTLKALVLDVPALFYVAGLIRSRRVFRRVGRGDIFTRENSDGLAHVGSALLGGALWAMAAAGLEPVVQSQQLGQTIHDIAAGASQAALAAVGLALLMIGRVMREATRLKAESDGFV
jgi:hypothetical protein